VAKRTREPQWLNRIVVDAIHDNQIQEHGGAPGTRDENLLESVLARPRNKWSYSGERDLAVFAAAYGFGFVRNHPYNDGNKRVGFLSIVTFLGLNGYDFTATDADVLTEILALAAGEISEEALADWIRNHMQHDKSR
jgi:death-on-curing protein